MHRTSQTPHQGAGETSKPLGVPEAARRLGVHPNTLYAWIDAGHIKATRIGPRGHWRLNPADVDELAAGGAA